MRSQATDSDHQATDSNHQATDPDHQATNSDHQTTDSDHKIRLKLAFGIVCSKPEIQILVMVDGQKSPERFSHCF